MSWLNSGPCEGGVYWVVRRVMSARRPEIIARLREWIEAHPDSPQAAAIRSVLDGGDVPRGGGPPLFPKKVG